MTILVTQLELHTRTQGLLSIDIMLVNPVVYYNSITKFSPDIINTPNTIDNQIRISYR